jgi:hypothetical protein
VEGVFILESVCRRSVRRAKAGRVLTESDRNAARQGGARRQHTVSCYPACMCVCFYHSHLRCCDTVRDPEAQKFKANANWGGTGDWQVDLDAQMHPTQARYPRREDGTSGQIHSLDDASPSGQLWRAWLIMSARCSGETMHTHRA